MILVDRQGHLMADSLQELHSFTRGLGLKRKYFQAHPKHPHYDLTSELMLAGAIRRGAFLAPTKEILRRLKDSPKTLAKGEKPMVEQTKLDEARGLAAQVEVFEILANRNKLELRPHSVKLALATDDGGNLVAKVTFEAKVEADQVRILARVVKAPGEIILTTAQPLLPLKAPIEDAKQEVMQEVGAPAGAAE